MNNQYDLIVVGGGFAGVSAAISGAREGLRILLIERYNCLGGAAGFALVTPFMPFYTTDPKTKEKIYLCGDLFLEIRREMNLIAGLPLDDDNGDFDEEILKLVLNRMCIKYGVNILYNTNVISAEVSDSKITSIKAFSKGVNMEFFADSFVDATGDAELSKLADCEYILGRETDSLCQPMTLNFRMGGVDMKKFRKNRHKINEIYKEFKGKGLIKNPRDNVMIFNNFNEGVLHFNTTRIIKKNPTEPSEVTEAEIEAREQVFEMWQFLKNNIEGFENCRVLSTALHIGIRESRKILGEYTLTIGDLKSLARFPDGIATANYEIDIHSPDGGGTSHYFFGAGEWYEIPYRCLIPKGMKNLLVAGRCISATHEAQASFRIMPYCSSLGVAAGIAASIAQKTGKNTSSVDIDLVRERLREKGMIL